MLYQNKLGFEWSPVCFDNIQAAENSKKPNFILKKMLDEYVWDIVHLENNPYSFLEVQTLLSGETVGGYSLFDQTQILNQHRALKKLIELLNTKDMALCKDLALTLHKDVAREEALAWGVFREGNVRISGTSHIPPDANKLNECFDHGLPYILAIDHPVERAIVYFLWGAMNQFFYDGNKRTSRMVMNFILMSHGYYYLSISGAKAEEFDNVMVDFYNTKNADNCIKFLLSCYQNWD